MMEKTLVLKSVSVFISLWGIALVFLWFRPKIELFWKLVATLIFLFYLWFFKEEIKNGISAIKTDWYFHIITFLKEGMVLLFVNLFMVWPFLLMFIFFKADDIGAEKLLKALCLLTLVLWVVFSVYVMYDKKIDQFLYEKLRDVIPFAKH